MWDRWVQDNHNSVVLARSGSGKSYLVKLEVLRNLYHGVHVAVVDPEDEYVRLAERVGGTVVQLGAPGVRLNPLDIPAADRCGDSSACRLRSQMTSSIPSVAARVRSSRTVGAMPVNGSLPGPASTRRGLTRRTTGPVPPAARYQPIWVRLVSQS